VKVTARLWAVETVPAECTHSLALDNFEDRFGPRLRRLTCLLCRQGWWESNGAVISSTEALRLVAELTDGPRPTGWAAAESEWHRLEEESLAPAH
jgi:hypothetical protein